MNELPKIVEKKNRVYYWSYKNEKGEDISLVVRYQDPDKPKKKWFRQYSFKNQDWEEGAPTPSPLYGIQTLLLNHSLTRAYIFEGEKCASAAHSIDLPAITSMMGSSNVEKADWAILARYRHIQEFVLVPDNDDPGHWYMSAVFKEIQKACPDSKVFLCKFQDMKKGDDLVDWLKLQPFCPQDWNGFDAIQKSNSTELQKAFLEYSSSNLIDADVYFSDEVEYPIFESDPQPLEEISFQTLPSPLHTLADPIVQWAQGVSMQMQISEDYVITPFLVSVGSLIGRKRGLELRPGSRWIEFANLWGMCIGRPAMMKSPAMNAAFHFLVVLANRAKAHFEEGIKKHQKEYDTWQIRKKIREEDYKRELKEAIKNHSDQAKIQFHEEEPPKEPKRKRYKTQDATIEKLSELLIENPEGLLLYRDELAGWLNSFEKHGHENDREFYLESWSGKGDYDVDRIGRGSLSVPALCLSIFGSIQPGPLSKHIRDTVRGGSGDNGLIQRFQAMVSPEPKTSWELVEGISISELEEPVQKIFDHLDRLEFDQDGNPVILSFTSEAQAQFDQWQRVCQFFCV
ncbi:YfjI family protein, partial [Estrella lausannensis]|uniref:YfjI family protein n=1 Tax=Estrella lausannensis TaxID=483423 RepID=UPI000BF1F713